VGLLVSGVLSLYYSIGVYRGFEKPFASWRRRGRPPGVVVRDWAGVALAPPDAVRYAVSFAVAMGLISLVEATVVSPVPHLLSLPVTLLLNYAWDVARPE
jgi:hypothetical protein